VDLDPAHIPARRQLFRINNILGRHQEAEEVLQKVFVPSVDDVLRQRLEGGHSTANSPALSEWLAGWKESADPFAMHDALAEAVSAGNLGQSLSTAERAAVLLTLRDTAEMRDEQSAAWMERNASLAARTGRNVEASQLYRRLNAVEPDNISALYGLAGSLQGGGDLEEARAVYESLVAINPGDPVAAGALRKAADLLRDSIRVMANYAGEDSPGRLADINRLQFGAIYQTRLARGLVVEAGPMFWLEMPGDSPNFTAQGFRVAARYRAADWVSFQGSFGYKAYNQGGAKNTFTGGAGAEFNYLDRVRIGLAYLREDIVRNRFNIPQGTQADVFQITLATNPLRDWSTETFGRMLFYNDNNTQGQIGGSVAWTMLRNPGVLQARIGGLGMWTAKESRDVFADGELVDVIYPYWTPGQYGQGFVALSWSQNLAPEAYAGQRELSYRLGLLASMDTTSNFLVGGELALRWEVVRNLILEAAATMQRSQQWNGAFATFSADYRF
jgi:tetratricopeptide (TPR) repeat protein